jgi:hypothetical protein
MTRYQKTDGGALMININEMIEQEIENGYGDTNAQAKVC